MIHTLPSRLPQLLRVSTSIQTQATKSQTKLIFKTGIRTHDLRVLVQTHLCTRPFWRPCCYQVSTYFHIRNNEKQKQNWHFKTVRDSNPWSPRFVQTHYCTRPFWLPWSHLVSFYIVIKKQCKAKTKLKMNNVPLDGIWLHPPRLIETSLNTRTSWLSKVQLQTSLLPKAKHIKNEK